MGEIRSKAIFIHHILSENFVRYRTYTKNYDFSWKKPSRKQMLKYTITREDTRHQKKLKHTERFWKPCARTTFPKEKSDSNAAKFIWKATEENFSTVKFAKG